MSIEDRLARLEQQVNLLADELLEHLSTVPRTAAPPPPPTSATAWVDMGAAQATAELKRLREWMSTVLVHHPRTMAILRPCWYRHPAVVQMLLDTRAAWIRAHRGQNPELLWALDWWQRHLPQLDQALSSEMGHCTSVRHDPDQVPSPAADEKEVQAYLDWWGTDRRHETEPPSP